MKEGRRREPDPSLLRALKEVAKTIRLQKRQFVFWLIILLFFGATLFIIQNYRYLFAATEPDIDEAILTQNLSTTIHVLVKTDGQALVEGRPVKGLIKPLATIDEFRYKVLDKPGTLIDQITVEVTFEVPLPESTKFVSYAIHGTDPATEKRVDQYTVHYNVTSIGPEATYTIIAELPPNTIHWPFWRRVEGFMLGIPALTWIVLAATMPFIAAIVLVLMFGSRVKSFFVGEPQRIIPTPPQALPPALSGILVNGRVSAREIAATLLDLANRGYLTVFNKGKGKFAFAKRRSWQHLHSFELFLLGQMFDTSHYKSSNEDIETSIGASLFSRRIAKVYLAMYDAITQVGYFSHNPASIHQRYRFTGLTLFFIGLLAFIACLAFEVKPPYVVFFFAGLMTMALVIILAADSVPLRTAKGEAARLDWLAFRNYLADPTPLGYVEGAQEIYEKYLPYAVVLKTEIAWANRFRNYPFHVPDWYDSSEESIAIEDFANGLYEIVGNISELFSAAKEPTVH